MLAEGFSFEVPYMTKIIAYTAEAQMSQTLYKNLGTGKKEGLKSTIKKSAKNLIKTKVITQIVMPQVIPL